MRIGYSYLRCSSDQQGDGDSVRRQIALAKAWCDRHNVRLDFNTFTDCGKSAFRGKHRLTGALGVFLADIKADRIPRGSALIVENLDRLSREDTYEAINLLTSLVIAGISVVTLSPSEMIYEKGGNNLGGLMNAVVEFGRANSLAGSMKDRSDQNWLMNKSLARESRKIMTAASPAWIAKRDRDVPAVRTKTGKLVRPKALVLDKNGKMTLDRTKAETVRRIFKMAVACFSAAQIVRKLIADKTLLIARTTLIRAGPAPPSLRTAADDDLLRRPGGRRGPGRRRPALALGRHGDGRVSGADAGPAPRPIAGPE
jgi:DNA invertase Pin-like site-specific DNA recombinase